MKGESSPSTSNTSPRHDKLTETFLAVTARPALLALPLLAIGILLRSYFFQSVSLFALVSLFAPIFTLSLFQKTKKAATVAGFVFGALSLGLIAQDRHERSHEKKAFSLADFTGKRAKVEGVLRRAPEMGRNALQIDIDVHRIQPENEPAHSIKGRMLLYCSAETIEQAPGDLLYFTAKLRPIRTTGNPGEFDYGNYLKNRGFEATAYLRSANTIKTLQENARNSFFHLIERQRAKLARTIDRNVGQGADAMIKALILGMKKAIDDDTREAYIKTGTAHLLAISGLHLGIIGFWVYLIASMIAKRSLWVLRRVSVSQFAAALALPTIWIYAMIAGLSVATLRAAFMITFYLSGKLFWRRSDAMNSLFFAAFFILMMYPFSLFEAGFQLSFLSVFSIIAGVTRLTALLPAFLQGKLYGRSFLGRAFRYTWFLVATSVVTTIATLPPLIHWFHEFSWVGLVVNIFAVPVFTAVLVPLLALANAVSVFSETAGLPLLLLGEAIVLQVNQALAWIVDAVGGAFYLPRPPLIAYALYYAGILFLLAVLEPREGQAGRVASHLFAKRFLAERAAFGALVCLAGSLLVGGISYAGQKRPDEGIELLLPHIRYGEALFAQTPEKTLLFGAGHVDDKGHDAPRRTIAPLLWEKGLTTIDRLYAPVASRLAMKAEARLESLFHIERKQYKTGGLACEKKRSVRICDDEAAGVSLFQGENGAIAYLLKEASCALVVLPSPHRTTTHLLEAVRQRANRDASLCVVQFGPGKNENFSAIVQTLSPEVILLGMNRKMARYIAHADWHRRKSEMKTIFRTDYDGAIEFHCKPNEGAWVGKALGGFIYER